MPCRNPIGVFVNEAGEEFDAPCHSWHCPDCAKVKKNQVLDRAGRGYELVRHRGGRVRALCLTLGPRADNKLMGRYFARFRAWLAKPRKHRKKYRSYRGINYFWTKEFQPQTGQLHLHVLIDAYIPQALLKRAWKWATYGTSNIVFITKIHNEIQKPAGYMTKYMAKELDQDEKFRRGERRYGFSRGWRSPFLLNSYRSWLKLLPLPFAVYKLQLGGGYPLVPPDHSKELAEAKEEWRRLEERRAYIKELFELD